MFFKRTGENDWEVLKGLCTECSTGTFSKETLKAVCYLQAMSQDYFNTDYGVDGVVGGNTLRALDAALQLMLPKNKADAKETEDDKKLQEEQNTKASEIIALDKAIKAETNPEKKKELEGKKTKLQEEAQKIVDKRNEIINKKKDPEKKDEKKSEKKDENKDKKETKETGTVDVETPEILKLKKDITEHFTLNGQGISREKEIANTISIKDGKYTLAINGYTNIQFSYQIEKQINGKTFINLAKSEGTTSKGLLKYNIKEANIDVSSKEKINITTELNQEKTKESLNNQLKDNNKDGDKIPDYKVTAITDKKITLEYTRNNTEKGKSPITETFDINLDENKNIIPDSQGNGKFSQWQEIKGKKTNAEYILDNKYQLPRGEALTRYAQSNSE